MKRAIWPAAFIALFFISMATFAVQKRYNGNVSGLLYIGTGVATDKVRCPDILDPDLYVRRIRVTTDNITILWPWTRS